jgi:hypothetical protein
MGTNDLTPSEVDKLPEAPDDKVGLMLDTEYFLIYDSNGKAWTTAVYDGVRMKQRHYYAVELDLEPRTNR